MSKKRFLMILLSLAGVFCCIQAFAAEVPQKDIDKLAQAPQTPGPIDLQARKDYFIKYMKDKIAESQELIKKYPDAENISKVREVLMMASFTLSKIEKGSAAAQKTASQQAEMMLKDKNASDENRKSANYVKYSLKIEKASPDEIRGVVKECFHDVAKTDRKTAYRMAIELAVSGGDKPLAMKYLKKARQKYPDDKWFRSCEQKLFTFAGKTFSAELTTLAGKKIVLPKDYLGKVVVVDFWATWCGPCRAYGPYLKKMYMKYKDKGVAVVGISLDDNRAALEEYLKKHDYPWPQTYSGGGWQDATAAKYRIRGIPSIWVIGKDGKVISDDARSDLDRILGVATK